MTAIARRLFLAAGVAGFGALVGGCAARPRRARISDGEPATFGGRLPVPALAPARIDGAVTVFDLVAQRGRTRFVGGGEANTCGYNQAYLGPTLRARRGARVRVEVRNDLGEPTTVHWHGMRLPAAYDGGPHQTIPAGGSWRPEWTIDQPAATLWYHPHPHGQTEKQVMAGLAGLFLIDDDRTPPGLPSDYGIDDVPLVLQDHTFDADGQFAATGRAETGYVGDSVLANGAVHPILDVPRGRVRLRVLNASPARVYNLALDSGRTFTMIASDGGLLSHPIVLDRLVLSPAERAEIIVDVAAGERSVLQTVPVDLGYPPDDDNASDGGSQDTIALLQLQGPAHPVTPPALPPVLAGEIVLPPVDGAERLFVLNGVTINNKRMEMARIDLVLHSGEVERWRVRATGDRPHNFHVHDAQFLVESVDGGAPPPQLRGWKDTVFLPVTSEVVLRFPVGRFTSETLPYMYHCHLLWHEDQGMMGQFLVVAADREAAAPRSIAGGTAHHG